MTAETTTVTASERLARNFHDTYERLAPSFGYTTRPESAVPWSEVPEPNRKLMIAVAGTALRNGYARTWCDNRESDEDFPPEEDVTLEDPDGGRWTCVDEDTWVCDRDPGERFGWTAALSEAGSLREVIA